MSTLEEDHIALAARAKAEGKTCTTHFYDGALTVAAVHVNGKVYVTDGNPTQPLLAASFNPGTLLRLLPALVQAMNEALLFHAAREELPGKDSP